MQTRFRKLTMFVSLLISFSLLLGIIPVSYAAVATTPVVNKKVYITKASYIQLTDANLIPSSSGATASFTFTFYNGDNTQINLVDYWARLKSKGGSKFTLTLLDQDKKKKVAPKSSTTLTYYSEVGSKMTLDQLVINIIKFDFTVAGYERTIAQYTFPQGYANYVKANGYKTVLMNNSNVNVRIDQINVTKKEKNYVFNLTYATRNTSKFGVTLPQYNYYVQTSKGLYKLALRNKSDETLTLEPTVLNAIRLTGNIPSTLTTTGWKLIITENVGSEISKVELPIVIFDIPFNLTTSTNTSVTSFSDDNGTYEVEIKNIQRLPWNNDDNVVAEISIKNKESVYLPLPDLTGLLLVDENIKLDAQVIKNSGDIGLAPGASTTINFVGTIPYAYQWKELKLRLSRKDGETTTELGDLTKSNISPLQIIKAGDMYNQQSNGSQLSAQVIDARTYSSETTESYAVFIDLTNKQKRSNVLPRWAGYFMTADGNYYEAKIIKSTNSIKPSFKDQLIVYTELPSGISKENIQLVVGEAFDTNGIMKADGTPKGFIRAVQLALPLENNELANFKGMEVGPFSVDFTYFNAIMDGSILDVDFAGSVKKDANYDGYSQSQLTLELEHKNTGQIIMSQVLSFEKMVEGATQWKLGDNYSEIRKDLSGTSVWDNYTLNVYDTFNEGKKKLASIDINWSSIINWLDGTH